MSALPPSHDDSECLLDATTTTDGTSSSYPPLRKPEVEGSAPITKPYRSARLLIAHAIHAVLAIIHILALLASILKWKIHVSWSNAGSIQTIVAAATQTLLTITIGILLSLTHDLAVDATIRHPPNLGTLHLRLNAWNGLWSSFSSYFTSLRVQSYSTSESSPALWRIFIYFGACAVLQISSSSIFGLNYEQTLENVLEYQTRVNFGSRQGDWDKLWNPHFNVTSDTRTRLSFPAVIENSRKNMFAGRVNDTRYPGLQARLIHDTLNLDNGVTQHYPFNTALVNATEINVHCSSVTAADVSTFVLPNGSTDTRLARPSGKGVLFQDDNTTDTSNDGVWINVTMPAPPYWHPTTPTLTFASYWARQYHFTQSTLATKIMFQPWAFSGEKLPFGHHQVVMIIATQDTNALLQDANQGLGSTYNLSTSDARTHAYVQILGCTQTSSNLTITISPTELLLDPASNIDGTIGPAAPHDDHTWDEFSWAPSTSSLDRQFIFAFTPSSPYNDTSLASAITAGQIGDPEATLAGWLDFKLLGPFDSDAKISLSTFELSLEQMFASYLWNVNRLCLPFDHLNPYQTGCAGYTSSGDWLFTPVVLKAALPAQSLIIVQSRAILSLMCSLIILLAGLSILGLVVDQPPGSALRNTAFLDLAQLLRGSSIPTVVAHCATRNSDHSEIQLIRSLSNKKLQYVANEDGGGYNIDIVDRSIDPSKKP